MLNEYLMDRIVPPIDALMGFESTAVHTTGSLYD
jgi:hypothetical protein